jgi:hypothetical protein
METDKIPAYYDNAPKYPYEQPTLSPKPTLGMQSPGQRYQQLWDGGEHPVSAMSPNSSLPWQSFPHDDQATYVGSEPEQEQRICGIRKRLFAIIAIVLGVVIIAVAIGGGVGGSMAAKQANEAAASETASATGSGSRYVLNVVVVQLAVSADMAAAKLARGLNRHRLKPPRAHPHRQLPTSVP